MRTLDSLSLQANIGQRRLKEICQQVEEHITVIRNFYLKNIQTDLLEEKTVEEAQTNSDIVHIRVELQGVPTDIMIDTGADVSLIDETELKIIQEHITKKIPTLPVNNITIIGATGRQNKTIRR